MDLQNIQDQLKTEFAKPETRIVYWFDDKGEFEDEVSELQLGEVKLHILDGTNWFYSKWLFHESDKDSKFLVYAPFPRPNDAENPLADICYYSAPYCTDRVSQMSQELGIDNCLKEYLSQYSNFWKNKIRIQKFKDLGISHFHIETIDIGLLAVLSEVKTPDFEEIMKRLLLGDSEKYIKAIEDHGLTERFWEYCNKYFGYKPEKPSLNDLASCMIVTYASASLKDTVPASMKSYILKKKNNVVVFVRNIMDHVRYQEAYDKLAEKADKTLRFVSRIRDNLKKDGENSKDRDNQLSDILGCDAFEGLDDIIIDWSLEQLTDEILDAQIEGMNIAQIADQRGSKAYHFGERFQYEYQALKYAYLLMKSVSLMEFTSDIRGLADNYQKETYLIDSYYRWFYYSFDQVSEADRFSNVRERVEHIYSNTYLQNLTPKWNINFTDKTMQTVGLVRQDDFYKHYLKGFEAKNNRIIVIISDAFRYECAKELMCRFELDEKCDAKIEAMLSVLPSVTSVGMAGLLPHKEWNVDSSLTVTVDGQACGDLAARDKILKAQNKNNAAVSFDEIFKNRKRTQELLQNKKVVYIYHNQVDARGDNQACEHEVFHACGEAIQEIYELVKQLISDVSAGRFYITADHGFLYKRDKLQEFEKISYPKDSCTYFNKRFLLTAEAVHQQGMVSRTMPYINQVYVTTPVGADIFKAAGGGQNYVHGGSSLQEMLVPVIELTTNTRGVVYDYVDVILTSVTRKVTNLITFFDFIQTEKVTDTMKARSITAYFTTESGEKISYEVPIAANSREDAPERRTFHEKFIFKTREYKHGEKYYLVLADANDEKNILQRYEFMIDIAFMDDFGF